MLFLTHCITVCSFVAVCTRPNGVQYQINEEVVIDCDRCTCKTGGIFDCERRPCPVIDGSICNAWGDPHYTSFDRRVFDFQGECEYVMAQSVGSNDFVISTNNNNCGTGRSCIRGVRIRIPGITPSHIYIGQRPRLYFDGIRQADGDQTYRTDTSIEVKRVDAKIFVTLIQYGVLIDYDGSTTINIQPASSYLRTNSFEGLCGNYDGNSGNDPTSYPALMCPGGGLRKRNAGSTLGCDNSTATVEAARRMCGVLRTSPIFSVCNPVVDPAPYIFSCESDYCCGNASLRDEYVCDSLSLYATQCTENGVQPSNWREEFCRKCCC